jgi:putative membrane protein
MAAVFYLPRILVNLSECADQPDVVARLRQMGSKLYRFGHVMFAIALLMGASLWIGFGVTGHWLHAKLLLVAVTLAYFIFTGRMLKSPRPLWSSRWLRLYNEAPVLLLFVIVYLALAKPF